MAMSSVCVSVLDSKQALLGVHFSIREHLLQALGVIHYVTREKQGRLFKGSQLLTVGLNEHRDMPVCFSSLKLGPQSLQYPVYSLKNY